MLCGTDLLALNSSLFCLKFLSPLYFWNTVSLDIELWSDQLVFSFLFFKDFPLYYELHNFWSKVCYNFYLSSMCNVSIFFFGCLQYFLFIFGFPQANYHVYSFLKNYFVLISPRFLYPCFVAFTDFEKFSAVILQILLFPLSFLLLFFGALVLHMVGYFVFSHSSWILCVLFCPPPTPHLFFPPFSLFIWPFG